MLCEESPLHKERGTWGKFRSIFLKSSDNSASWGFSQNQAFRDLTRFMPYSHIIFLNLPSFPVLIWKPGPMTFWEDDMIFFLWLGFCNSHRSLLGTYSVLPVASPTHSWFIFCSMSNQALKRNFIGDPMIRQKSRTSSLIFWKLVSEWNNLLH